jgi:hypothetical protein
MQSTKQDHAIIHKVTSVTVYGTFKRPLGFKIRTFVENRQSTARTIQNSRKVTRVRIPEWFFVLFQHFASLTVQVPEKMDVTKRFEQPLLEESPGSKIAELPTIALSTAFSYHKSE